MADNVTSLGLHRALKSDDNRLWSPADCLQDAINDIKDKPCDKLIIIRINTADNMFNVGYHSANIKVSEMVAALEVLKFQLMQEMEY